MTVHCVVQKFEGNQPECGLEESEEQLRIVFILFIFCLPRFHGTTVNHEILSILRNHCHDVDCGDTLCRCEYGRGSVPMEATRVPRPRSAMLPHRYWGISESFQHLLYREWSSHDGLPRHSMVVHLCSRTKRQHRQPPS